MIGSCSLSVWQISVGGRALDLVQAAVSHNNVKPCSDSNIQSDDPCLKLPCGRYGRCVTVSSSDYTCNCDAGYMGKLPVRTTSLTGIQFACNESVRSAGKHCEVEKNACNKADSPCLNDGLCEPQGTDSYICRCKVGWQGQNCETSK